jgi:integrase/recombinase XerC
MRADRSRGAREVAHGSGTAAGGNPDEVTPIGWDDALDSYVLEQDARGQSPETIRTRLSYLHRWAQGHQVDAPREQLVAWLARPGWAPATRKAAQAALRSFYAWANRTGVIEVDPAAALPPVRVPRGLPRPASEAHVHAGRAAADPADALMVALAANAGLRRAEIASLRREDLTPWGLHIVGKGGRHRMVPVGPRLRAEVESRGPGFLFPGRFAGHVHPATVQKHVKAAAGVAPHALRHRFATRAYEGSRDLFAVQQLLGHASPETTQVYVAVAGGALAAAVAAAA